MIQDSVFVCGASLLAHPVSYLFHLGENVRRGTPDADALEGARLVLADCRTAAAGDVAQWLGSGLDAGKPVLLLCPSADTLAALDGKLGLLPLTASAALLVSASRNPSGQRNYRVHALEYSATPTGSLSAEAPSKAAEGSGPKGAADAAIPCACIDFAALGSAFVDPAAADLFKVQVEKAMDPRHAAEVYDSPPTGLKYFTHVYNTSRSFTYSQGGTPNPGAGVANFTWTVWGFLNQTQQSNSQYLVVEGRISVSPGTLYSNTECDRGFGNAYVQGTLTAPMQAYNFVPTSGDGSFSGTVSIPISYKSPTGGYLIWNYSGSVNNSITSWSCKSISSGESLGAEWWMTSPCNGSNVDDDWDDAFTFWGHVNDLTGASSGSLDVNSVSAWVSNTLLTGNQTVNGNFGWQGVRFWGSSCSPGMYWATNAGWNWFYNVNPGFSVDFTPINP